MKRELTQVWGFIIGWAFCMILLAFFIQSRDFYGGNPIVRPRLAVQEAFKNPMDAVSEPVEPIDGLAPGNPDLDNRRRPYTILNGWFEPKSPEDGAVFGPPGRKQELPDDRYGQTVEDLYKETKVTPRKTFTSQTCYESDFQARLEPTGNFRQMTNNYKRGDPDSCTAPLQDVALSYYKIDPLPDSGCLSNTEWKMQALKNQ